MESKKNVQGGDGKKCPERGSNRPKINKRRATGNFKLEGVVKMSGKEFWVLKNKSAEKPQKYSRRANLKGGGGHKAQ